MIQRLTLLTLFIFLISYNSKSQYQDQFNQFWDWSDNYFLAYPTKGTNNGKITEVKMIHQSFTRSGKPKKNKGTSWKKFDEKGRPVEMSYLNKKGVYQRGLTIAYDANGRKTYIDQFYKNRLNHKTSFTYETSGKYKEILFTGKKGEIEGKSTWTYNKDGDVVESKSFKKGGIKLKRRWTYTYYGKGQLAKTILYNGKGKIKNSWSYDCKQEGQKLEKRKNETQVCKWEQSSAEYLTKTMQTFDEKGRVVKYVTKYTIKDTLPVEHSTYDQKDRLKLRYTYNKKWDLQTSRARYTKKGKQLWEVKCEYQSDSLLISEITSHKGKIDGRREFKYNDENLVTQQQTFRKSGKPWYMTNFEYTGRK